MLLDAGCGNNPKGEINIDVETKYNVKNFIKADVQNLPFKTKVFSESLSHHVIEHLCNPENLIV